MPRLESSFTLPLCNVASRPFKFFLNIKISQGVFCASERLTDGLLRRLGLLYRPTHRFLESTHRLGEFHLLLGQTRALYFIGLPLIIAGRRGATLEPARYAFDILVLTLRRLSPSSGRLNRIG